MAETFPTTVTVTHSNSGGTISNRRTYDTETFQPVKVVLTASQANKRVNFSIPVLARLQTLMIKTPVDIHIYVNAPSTGSPAQALAITSEVGLDWDRNSGFACPLTAVPTDLYITNDEAVAVPASVGGDVIEILYSFDPSP
jgi:hypothetical protein